MAIGPTETGTEIGIETGTEIAMAIETEITETDRIDKENRHRLRQDRYSDRQI